MPLRIVVIVVLISVVVPGYAQVDFKSSTLPIFIINTNGQTIVDDPKIVADLGVIDNADAPNLVTDPHNGYEGKMGIEIRGSSSQGFPKKQYSVELRDDVGNDREITLLGFPKEEDWVFSAPYNDKSLMRDVLAYRMGRDMGQYAPRTKFVELVLNGQYQGVYILIEKIKRDKNRVNINKLEPTEITGDNLTGGYIVKIDKPTGDTGEGWDSPIPPRPGTSKRIKFIYEEPSIEDIVPQQKTYIQNYVTQFENALASDAFKDPANGYAKFIDVNSFIDYMLIQEVSKNVDGYRLSTFLYKQRDSDGGKLFMGPFWDFNLGYGNADYCTASAVDGFVFSNFNNVCGADPWQIPFWWTRFMQDQAFRDKVGTRWKQLRETTWKESSLLGYIDSVTTVLKAGPATRNFQQWPVLGQYIWPNAYVGVSYQDEINYLKSWLTQRLTWLDANLPKAPVVPEEPGPVTGVEDVNKSAVSAYPNPFTGAVTVDYALSKPGVVRLRFTDALGRSLNAVDLVHDKAGEYSYRWQPDSPPGLYYFSLQQGTNVLGQGKLSKR